MIGAPADPSSILFKPIQVVPLLPLLNFYGTLLGTQKKSYNDWEIGEYNNGKFAFGDLADNGIRSKHAHL